MRTTGTRWRAVTMTAALALTGTAACSGLGPAPDAATSTTVAGDPGPAPGAGRVGTTATTLAATTTTKPPRTLSLAAVGDLLSHGTLIVNAGRRAGGKGYEMESMFDQVRPLISQADFAICHQETPISTDNVALTAPNSKNFNAPRELAAAIKNAGFDACDTASNHTWDRQMKGVNQTLEMLEANGIGHAGSSRNQAEAETPPIYDAKGIKIGHLAYSYTIPNNSDPNSIVPDEAPWLREMLWPAIGVEGILERAKKIKARGAEIVVVSFHWGAEYQRTPTKYQRDMAKQLLASPDIDVILGDHVHVVQPCEKINGKYVLYGMGNFISNQSPTQDTTLKVDNEDGTLSTFSFQEDTPGHFKTTGLVVTPTHVTLGVHQAVPVTPESNKASYDRTVAAITMLGPACDATIAG